MEYFLNSRAILYKDVFTEELYQTLLDECKHVLQMTPLYVNTPSGVKIKRNHDQVRGCMGDQSIIFKYNNLKRPLHEWTPTVLMLRDKISELRGWIPNKCTINKYTPNGLIVPHRDKDYITGFVPNHEFVIASFGATRTMLFIDQLDQNDITKISLPNNSLLVVSGSLDDTHLHGIHPEPGASGDRLSLAFKMHFNKD